MSGDRDATPEELERFWQYYLSENERNARQSRFLFYASITISIASIALTTTGLLLKPAATTDPTIQTTQGRIR